MIHKYNVGDKLQRPFHKEKINDIWFPWDGNPHMETVMRDYEIVEVTHNKYIMNDYGYAQFIEIVDNPKHMYERLK